MVNYYLTAAVIARLLFVQLSFALIPASSLSGQQNTEQKPSLTTPLSAFERPFPNVEMNQRPSNLPEFDYIDVGGQIPNYVKSNSWGELGTPLSLMQQPLPPDQALQHFVTPKNFRVELFASEPDLQGKPISMAWDERGRLWVCETIDYPNEMQEIGMGHDLIRICEDSNKDGRADKFTVFADKLSIPSSLAFSNGGVIVQNGIETVFLKDTNNDDIADERSTWITGWAMGDTHGGVSNFQYGLDNWIWAMQGYNASNPIAHGKPQQPFRMGFFRLRTDGSEVEFLRSTNNNTWGLGITEEGLAFGSTANGNPSVFLPIPNRYYERVRGWTPSLTLASIADSNRFLPVTSSVRQVDHFGGYTAAAGHAIYTARQYPQEYWNRVAFVCEPTGHLVASFVITQSGSGFSSTNPFNLLASHDEWSAPIMAEVGPDGNVWVIDWYNYIVQHNPTPKGFQTGKGNAYESNLRDKKFGRIYRVIYEGSSTASYSDLSLAKPSELVAALNHSVLLVRKHAQRLLVERKQKDVVPELLELVRDTTTDAIGLNVAAIHALWTLHGLATIDAEHTPVLSAVFKALRHPSAGVRRNAIQVLPPISESTNQLIDAGVLHDGDVNVRLSALLALSDLPLSERTASALLSVLSDPRNHGDGLIADAATCAAAQSGAQFLIAVAQQHECTETVGKIARLVAEHVARGDEVQPLVSLFEALNGESHSAVRWILPGLSAGWKQGRVLALTDDGQASLRRLAEEANLADRTTIIQLALQLGCERFEQESRQLVEDLLDIVGSEKATDEEREVASQQVVGFLPDSEQVAQRLVDTISPRISPTLARGIVSSLQSSKCDSLGAILIARLTQMPPDTKSAVVGLLLKRTASTLTLLKAIETRQVALNELALDQRQALSRHPNQQVRAKMNEILEQGGSFPNLDRQQVLIELASVAFQRGDQVRGKELFAQHCSKCHLHQGVGATIGPDLTGMSVHPKDEMLVHLIDPNQSVESNFRAYSVLTVDGLVFVGMLAAETKTAIELFDTEGKRQVILREDIEQLSASVQSIMPEGFEKTLSPKDITDLLEYLAIRDTYVPLDISKAATVATDRGMFVEPDGPERILFDSWTEKLFQGVPFRMIEPRDGQVLNAIVLHSPLGSVARQLPTSVALTCSTPAKAVHILGGVAGWAHPLGNANEVAMIVRLNYADGQFEDHELLNGVHIADYIRRIDVPKSEFAFAPGGKQLRYLAIRPSRTDSLSTIEFVKGHGNYAPVIMAVTVEPLQGE